MEEWRKNLLIHPFSVVLSFHLKSYWFINPILISLNRQRRSEPKKCPKGVMSLQKFNITPLQMWPGSPRQASFSLWRLATQRTLVKFSRKREFFWSPTWTHAVWAEKSVSASHPIKTLARRLRELALGLDRFKVRERSGVARFPSLEGTVVMFSRNKYKVSLGQFIGVFNGQRLRISFPSFRCAGGDSPSLFPVSSW